MGVYWQVMKWVQSVCFQDLPLCLGEAMLLGRGGEDRGDGKEAGEAVTVLLRALRSSTSWCWNTAAAGQRDAGAERGCEMFPSRPETGGSRNPTGNLVPMEPLT